MIRVVSALVAAILCHPSTTWAEEYADVEAFPSALIEMSIDVVREANDLGAIRTCPTDRCLRHRALKSVGKTAVMVVALAALQSILTPATAQTYIAGFAAKSLAKCGLAALGVTGAAFVVAAYAAYESTVGGVTPADSMPLADSIMFNDHNRRRFLRMPRAQILNIALHDRLIGHELVILAHAVLTARNRAKAAPEVVSYN